MFAGKSAPIPPSSPGPKGPTGLAGFALRLLVVGAWLVLAGLALKTLITAIQAHGGQAENVWAIVAFLPAVLLTALNVYLFRKGASLLFSPAVLAWIAASLSHGQSTIGPVIGLLCYFLDPINPVTWMAMWYVSKRWRRPPKPTEPA